MSVTTQTVINLPKALTFNNGEKVIVSECEIFITSKGVYDLEQKDYRLSIFRKSNNKIGAEIGYKGVSAYSDFSNLDLSTESYTTLNELN